MIFCSLLLLCGYSFLICGTKFQFVVTLIGIQNICKMTLCLGFNFFFDFLSIFKNLASWILWYVGSIQFIYRCIYICFFFLSSYFMRIYDFKAKLQSVVSFLLPLSLRVSDSMYVRFECGTPSIIWPLASTIGGGQIIEGVPHSNRTYMLSETRSESGSKKETTLWSFALKS
jgi:hypothetical protein